MRLFDWFQPTFGGVARSPKWGQVRRAFLKLNPFCAACGSKGGLLAANEVHHVQPYHLHPALELDPTNFITFCRPHHLLVGHLMSWPSYNADARKDAAYFLAKIQTRP